MVTQPRTLPESGSPEQRVFGRWRPEQAYRVGVVFALLCGIVVRSYHVLRWDFPLNDGGLFYQMVRDLQHNSYRLPDFTTFNQGNIPFGYPPLTMYIAAAVDDVTPFSLMTLFRLLPLVATCGTVVAFFLLAQRMLKSRVAVVAAVLVFALTPRSFIWLLMGGGLTRSFGLLFAILAIWQVQQLYEERDRRHLLPAVLLSGATVLSHVETGYFLAFTIAIFWIGYGRNRDGLINSIILASGTLLMTVPWWAAVMHYHGLGPFRAAMDAGGSVFTNQGTREYVRVSIVRVVSSSEPWYPLLGTLGFLGAIVSVVNKRYLLLAWWIATIVLDPRAYPTLSTVPVALLAGVCVADLLVPLLQRASKPQEALNGAGRNGGSERGPALSRIVRTNAALFGVLGLFFLFSFTGAFVTKPGLGGEGSFLKPLSPSERELMAWIAEETPPDSRFLVVPRTTWEIDKEGEWFPVLAKRESVITVQGYEWVGDGGFHDQQSAYWEAYNCGFRTTQCLDQWLRRWPWLSFQYVYVPKFEGVQCCSTLMQSLEQDPRYVRVYNTDGGTIWEFRPDEANPPQRPLQPPPTRQLQQVPVEDERRRAREEF